MSVNVGSARPNPKGTGPDTGIHKVPVRSAYLQDPGPKRVEGGLGVSGVAGDVVGDGRHHGGSTQAVYAFASEELAWWAGVLGRDLPPGSFGENLTTVGLDVDAAIIGERWRIGGEDGPIVRVTGPRIPCNVFRLTMQEQGWVKRFAERGRTGSYLAVERPGIVTEADAVDILSQPDHGVTVPMLFRAITTDPRWAEQALRARPYLEGELVAKLEKRSTYGLDAEPGAGTAAPAF